MSNEKLKLSDRLEDDNLKELNSFRAQTEKLREFLRKDHRANQTNTKRSLIDETGAFGAEHGNFNKPTGPSPRTISLDKHSAFDESPMSDTTSDLTSSHVDRNKTKFQQPVQSLLDKENCDDKKLGKKKLQP